MNEPRYIEGCFQGDRPDRLDRVLGALAGDSPGFDIAPSRSQIKRLIELGFATINGVLAAKAGAEVKPGDQVRLAVQEAEPYAIEAQPMRLDVLFEDEWLLILNKPAGLVVHPGAGNKRGTLLNALAARFGGEVPHDPARRPWIVHRLDKDTSGVLVTAKDEVTHRLLSAAFAKREVHKQYLALVLSSPRGRSIIDTQESGSVNLALGRHPKERTKIAVMEDGREALTHWRRRERLGYANVVELRIETGRTHQIRVHLAHIRAPVLGDQVYGDFTSLPPQLRKAQESFGRQALHAERLEFSHPRSGETVKVSALPDSGFMELRASFERYGRAE